MRADAYDADRFDRSKRIDWVDIDGIMGTRCLVVGAGALGNEAVKCLVLSGFRDIDVVDMDDIVLSNLNRCLFFRESDVRTVMKADVVAARASELDPEARIRPVVGRVQDLEDWDYGLILGCVDNVEARLHVNAHAAHLGIPYVDGATDGFRGKVHVVIDGGPCLQCAMNRTHMAAMEKRFTCTGRGTTAFTPRTAAEITTTSVVAAMQVREAVKIASGRRDLCVRGVSYYDGVSGASEILEVRVDAECPNHG